MKLITTAAAAAAAPLSVAYLGFCEGGGRAKNARFEAPEAPMGWSVGRGCPLPTEEGVLGGGCAPSPEI